MEGDAGQWQALPGAPRGGAGRSLLARAFQFPDIVEFSETMANAGKTVIVAALDGTFQRKVRHQVWVPGWAPEGGRGLAGTGVHGDRQPSLLRLSGALLGARA